MVLRYTRKETAKRGPWPDTSRTGRNRPAKLPTMLRYLLPVLALLVPTVLGASGNIDVRALGGHAYGLEDTPPHAWLAGAGVSVPVSSRLRVSFELMHAQMYGRDYYERRAILLTPVFEYEFLPKRRVRPYMAGGFGFTLYRSLFPTGPDAQFEWETGGSFNLGGGAGLRLFLTKRLFVSPEVRVGLIPFLRSTLSVGYRF